MTGPGKVHTLEVWRAGLDLTEQVYRLSAHWPDHEKYGLVSQGRRAAASIPTNLAEGVGRGSPGEAARFARIALGSAYELHTLLHLVHRLHQVPPAPDHVIFTELDVLTRRMTSFIAYQDKQAGRSPRGTSP